MDELGVGFFSYRMLGKIYNVGIFSNIMYIYIYINVEIVRHEPQSKKEKNWEAVGWKCKNQLKDILDKLKGGLNSSVQNEL